VDLAGLEMGPSAIGGTGRLPPLFSDRIFIFKRKRKGLDVH